jgi:hypothetical protein
MSNRVSRTGLIATILFPLICELAGAQSAQFQVPLTFEAASGPAHSMILRIGVSGDGGGGSIMDNSYGVDLGTQFGAYEEFSLPPAPPTPIFDVRLKDIPSRVPPPPFPSGLDTGVEGDYRGYSGPAQIDSYFVACDGSDLEANMLRISWPSTLANHGTSWTLKSQFGLFPNVDMLTATETTVTGALAGAGGVLIIKTGAMGTTGVELVDDGIPVSHRLYQNYPNPFNPSTEIRFSLARSGRIQLTLFDMLGREVSTLVDGEHAAGTYALTFDGSNLASGIYLYRLTTGDGFSEVRRLMLMK